MIYTQDRIDGSFFETSNVSGPNSPAANLLCAIINFLPKTKYYLKSLNTYFGLLKTLMSLNLDIIKYLLQRKLIGRLACYFFDASDDIRYQKFLDPLPFNEAVIKLHYGPEITDDPNQNSEEDFKTPELVNLTRFFSVLWELLSHSTIPNRESYNKFVFHKSGINYQLDPLEVKLLDLNSYKIRKMFSYVTREEKRSQRVICKIIAFMTFGSGEDSQPIFEFLDDGLKSGKSEKTTEDCFRLIRILGKVNDLFQPDRVLFL